MQSHTKLWRLCCIGFALSMLQCCSQPSDSALTATDETRAITEWREQRVKSLRSETGWLTLAGLYWLKPGNNTFGRATDNALVLNHPALPDHVGAFVLANASVSFTSTAANTVLHDGQPVSHINLATDATDKPTILSVGSLRFYAIERAGNFGVRVRDTQSPVRTQFKGINYFPIDASWRMQARFEPYEPVKKIPIVNILGMTETMEAPGALVFTRNGQTWRLDALLESPTDDELMVMFTDSTTGHASYGAGRYLSIARPKNSAATTLWLDFNRAYNPPCAFTEFATCPLPPKQNRLSLPISAGEMKYTAHP
jgi:uncharacterized protein